MGRAHDKELVLVFKRHLLQTLGPFQGLSRDVDPYLSVIFKQENNRFVPRRKAESDPTLKQLIPYVILRYGTMVFHYVRGKDTDEGRLRAKGSIGIGGHIQPQDLNLFTSPRTFYMAAAAREVSEEVWIEAEHRERIVALINDDSTPVGQVHFGIVHLWDLDRPAVYRRERQITNCGFMPLEELKARRGSLEGWSQLSLLLLE